MRFFADGPSIPDELLEQRDRGNVVFFCGAGVSRPAGLPSFFGLAHKVMRALGTPQEAESRGLLEQPGGAPNLDRVFNLLQQEYKREEIDGAVSRILRTPRLADIETHTIILRLSRNLARRPQVVTTNFDLLFERADRSLKFHVAPALPDLASLGSFEGVVYLHGRCEQRSLNATPHQRLMLSSSDFGRAYLADGWATRFVRDLLRTYVIALVGYSASDPPVRYLLEGLHSRDDGNAAEIYAFDHGDENKVHSQWRGLGVRAIPYVRDSDAGHSRLWNTLKAWAGRADDPDTWRRSIIYLAQTNPRQLAPYQRGQVAALVGTSEGASLFASASPPPPADWLCVFDRGVRYSRPQNAFGREEPDPFSLYALDDDPPPPEAPAAENASRDPLGIDLISISPRDERTDHHRRLAGVTTRAGDYLPARLAHLARWFTRVAGDPVAVWWVAGYETIHSHVLASIHQTAQHHEQALGDFGRHAWRLLLERFRHSPEERHDWHHFLALLKREGWKGSVLREFERVVQPHLAATRALSYRLCPPLSNGTIPPLRDIVDLEVKFPLIDGERLSIPADSLPAVFEIVRRALQHGSTLLSEIDSRYWHTTTFHPTEEMGDHYLNEASRFLHWARALFDGLAVERSDVASDELRRWPSDDIYFFNKLRIYAWMRPDLVTGHEAASGILSLSEKGFWYEYHRRELLHTLRARWQDFGLDERRRIEDRIGRGRGPFPGEEEEDYRVSKIHTAATVWGWLEQNGCELSDTTRELLVTHRESMPGWTPSWDQAADHSFDGRAGFVAIDSDPSELVGAPVSGILDLASRRTRRSDLEFKRHAPFDGLVAQHPRRALAAVSFRARRGEYPTPFWRTLLTDWPKDTNDRLLKVCAARLCRLPDAVFVECRHQATEWFRETAARLALAPSQWALALCDRILGALLAAGAEAMRSARGDVTIGGVVQDPSRRTYDHAINSPAGHVAVGLLRILSALKPEPGAGIPSEIKERVGRLLRLPGEAGDHVASTVTFKLRWLYGIDPSWIRSEIIPLFAPDHPLAEPAWNGLLWDTQFAGPELFALLKRDFLRAFAGASTWRWDDNDAFNRLVDRLLIACYWRRNNGGYVTYAEARVALRLVNDEGRAHAIQFLATAFSDERWWVSFGRPFMQRAWPRESRFQTPSVSQQLAFLAEQLDDQFPDVVRTVLPLLVPVEQLDMTTYRALAADEGSPLAARFPRDMLELLARLIPDEPRIVPYALEKTLETIAGASPRLRADPRWKRLSALATRA